jgi:hypothetical protein
MSLLVIKTQPAFGSAGGDQEQRDNQGKAEAGESRVH